ncbi:MAG: FUSC family protein [Actinobacteria bacterium]|nr:FUSC family protein [Actinomycetota bacterium]MCB9412467.1 FUSC family protein [Actinomycetota bacterium]
MEWLWLARIHLRQGLMELPPPGSTWRSAARRAIVVAAFFAAGLATDSLHLTIMGAFGALQVGLMEAVRPGRELAAVLGVSVLAISVSAFAASALGGKWWVLPLVVSLGYVYGCVSELGLGPLAVSLGSVAIAVIFAGIPQSPYDAAVGGMWVAIGGAVQAALWLLDLRHDRRRHIRRLLAVKTESLSHIARRGVVDQRVVQRSFTATDRARDALSGAGLPSDQRSALESALVAQLQVLRALLTWIALRQPGLQARMAVALHLEAIGASLRSGKPVDASMQRPSEAIGAAEPQPWLATAALGEAMDRLSDAASAAAGAGTPGQVQAADWEIPPPGTRPPSSPGRSWRDIVSALHPRAPGARFGLRMALALAIAESLTLLVSVGHSFWLPLTVVFILRPEVVNTLFRGLTRLAGNFVAVVTVPTLLAVTAGRSVVLVTVVLALATVTYRFFTGNYALTSFGLAGTVLVLDTTLAPGGDLFFTRIAATAAGALLALIVVVAVPVAPRANAGVIIAKVAATFGEWAAQVRSGLGADGSDSATLARSLAASRAELQKLGSASEAALFEPRMRSQGVRLTIALEAAWRMEVCLVALSFYTRVAGGTELPRTVGGSAVDSPERLAVAEQQLRLESATRDLNAETDGTANPAPP